jgi:hypothetical protein
MSQESDTVITSARHQRKHQSHHIMKTNLESHEGHAVKVVKNEETNGYIMQFENDLNMHVQFWHDRSARAWYCAPYHNDGGHQAAATDNCYRKDDIIHTALGVVDDVIEDNISEQY